MGRDEQRRSSMYCHIVCGSQAFKGSKMRASVSWEMRGEKDQSKGRRRVSYANAGKEDWNTKYSETADGKDRDQKKLAKMSTFTK